MALRVRFLYPTGAALGYSIERLSDGLLYDFATAGPTAGTFTASPATPIAALAADTGNFAGRYRATLAATPVAQFPNGEYCVSIHEVSASNAVVAQLSVTMFNGDDAPAFPAPPAPDPWASVLPGAYEPGTAGAILGTRLDSPVSSRLPASAYEAPKSADEVATAVWNARCESLNAAGTFGARLDATVSSRLAADAYEPPPSVARIAAGVWDEPTDAHGSAGSFGARLDATVSSRLASTAYVAAPSADHVAEAVWGAPCDGHDAAGSFGARLDASISSRLAAEAYSAPPGVAEIVDGVWDETIEPHRAAGTFGALLDAPISSRSTYDGGPVAGVVEPVTVGVNHDKGGYTLASDGLDAIEVEAGINARQALAPILAAVAGVVTGAGTGTIIIRGGNSATTRITAATDGAGNRSSVTLMLPA